MKRCPICGRYLLTHMVYDRRTCRYYWKCNCGYNLTTDRAGLSGSEVIDRYHLKGNGEYNGKNT